MGLYPPPEIAHNADACYCPVLVNFISSGTEASAIVKRDNAFDWFKRALSGVRYPQRLKLWWGREDWHRLFSMSHESIRDEIVQRFKSELSYKHAVAWPIYRKKAGGQIVYYMIHASDHGAAPDLMRRAYEEAVLPTNVAVQVPIKFL